MCMTLGINGEDDTCKKTICESNYVDSTMYLKL